MHETNTFNFNTSSLMSINTLLSIFSSSTKKIENEQSVLVSKPEPKISGFRKATNIKDLEESEYSKSSSEENNFFSLKQIDWDNFNDEEFDEFGDTLDKILIP